jgi:hypothetical protein
MPSTQIRKLGVVACPCDIHLCHVPTGWPRKSNISTPQFLISKQEAIEPTQCIFHKWPGSKYVRDCSLNFPCCWQYSLTQPAFPAIVHHWEFLWHDWANPLSASTLVLNSLHVGSHGGESYPRWCPVQQVIPSCLAWELLVGARRLQSLSTLGGSPDGHPSKMLCLLKIHPNLPWEHQHESTNMQIYYTVQLTLGSELYNPRNFFHLT